MYTAYIIGFGAVIGTLIYTVIGDYIFSFAQYVFFLFILSLLIFAAMFYMQQQHIPDLQSPTFLPVDNFKPETPFHDISIDHKATVSVSNDHEPNDACADSKANNILFEYQDVSTKDDTDKLVSLLRRLSTDMDILLDSTTDNNDNDDAQSCLSSISDDDRDQSTPPVISSKPAIDPNWEASICSKYHFNKWGSYSQCSSQSILLRGSNYLHDRIKIPSRESVLSLAHVDIFTTSHRIQHIAQDNTSWFHQNRDKLPPSLFFIIIHLRLDSTSTSIVQYFYIDTSKHKYLLDTGKCNEMLKDKGKGYFAINSPAFDESGMFWNFINGPCEYRNDRLKLIARKEEGPWYLYIPSNPAMIGQKVSIQYYRGYNATVLNSTQIYNTRSEAYDPYDFLALYHDAKVKEVTNDVPCSCGMCEWVNTNGDYADYLEIDVAPEVNMIARNIINIACPLAKSLQVEMHWTLEGQRKEELPERMLCSARLTHIDLTKTVV
eukprot:241292_1